MRDNNYWYVCNGNTIRDKVAEFIDNSPLLNKLKGDKYFNLEDAIVSLIETNKQHIHDTVVKENEPYSEYLPEDELEFSDGFDGCNSPGTCPCCGSQNLSYGRVSENDNGMYYPWKCCDCEAIGEETYDIKFFGYYFKRGIK